MGRKVDQRWGAGITQGLWEADLLTIWGHRNDVP